MIVSPCTDQTAREDEALAERLKAYRDSLSEEERSEIVRKTKELKAYQEEPSSQEDLEKIPMLQRSDIEKKAEGFSYEVKEESGIPVIHSPLFTSGIGYLKVLFDFSVLPDEDIPYGALLKSVLGYVDTEHYSYSDLTSEIYLNSGGLDFSVGGSQKMGEPGNFTGTFTASVKVLYEKLDFAFEMLAEILLRSKLTDEKRLGEILDETMSRARMRLENSSHSSAAMRAASYYSPLSSFYDRTGGIGFYQFLEKITERCSKEEGYRLKLGKKLMEVAKTLFTASNMTVSYTADEEGYGRLPAALAAFKAVLPEGNGIRYPYEFKPELKNEGFRTASQVNYVACCGTFGESAYTGALKVLKVILNYEYLWVNLRVKGGAYGCMSSFGRNGETMLVSYRDPKLGETNRVYEGIPEYLRTFSIDDRDMTKYVIGAFSELDAPLNPAAKGARNLGAWLSGVTDEMIQRERDQVLNVTQEDIRALAGLLESVLNTGALCAIGNDQQIVNEQELFNEIKHLYH